MVENSTSHVIALLCLLSHIYTYTHTHSHPLLLFPSSTNVQISDTMDENENKDHQEDTLKYNFCCINNKKCGPYKRFGRNGIVRANQLNEPINKHLKTLKTKFSDQWNEISLIENQMGKTFQENDICAYHRYTLGICWSQPKICSHPLHQLVGKGKKGSVTHTVPEETWKVICSQHPVHIFHLIVVYAISI